MNLYYHNTNDLQGKELEKADKTAAKQEDWILAFFRKYKHQLNGPSAVKRAYDKDNGTSHLYGGTGVPITSIRRACSNLSKGVNSPLIMRKDLLKVESMYGGKEFLLELRKEPEGDLFGTISKQEMFGGLQ
jgi:hypothetical protein